MPKSSPRPRAIIDYHFRQRFAVPARSAFAWATDFTPDDWEIAGGAGGRVVEWLAPTLVKLTDTSAEASGGSVTKTRLVQLYPASRTWVSTHIGGPMLHSQFRYAIRSIGRGGSELAFDGRELRWDRPYPPADVPALARKLRAEDAQLWRTFARAMERDARSRPTAPPARK